MCKILCVATALLCFCLIWPTRQSNTPLKELHIGALFPMEAGSGGWPGGQACLPAVQMAFDDVNLNPELLPNYALRLHHHNSKCQPGLAARQLYELLYKPPVKLVLLAGCSPVTTLVGRTMRTRKQFCQQIAETAPVWNLLVLSYGASSPALSNRARFPTLFRTHPSANMQNPTRVHLFEKFRWRRITILQSVEEVFDSTAKDLEEQCREKDIRVERHSFYGDPTDALKAIRRQDARIIVGLFYVTEARRVLCQAYHLGLYGRKYVWFMIGWYADTWFIPPEEEALNCTREQMERVAQYHFTTESIMLSRDKMPAISGMTGTDFLERLKQRVKTDPQETGGWPEAPLAYDAVWFGALALTLNCTMGSLPVGVTSLEQFTYNSTRLQRKMYKCMKNVQFQGVSGHVMFSDQGDRIARTQIEQMQNGKYVLLGYYDSSSQTLEWLKKEKFFGGRGPPPDSTRVKPWPIAVDFRLYLGTMVLVCVGCALAVVLYGFSRRYAVRRILVQSQPECNTMLLTGCVLCLLSLVLLGLPTASVAGGKTPLLRLPRTAGWFSAFCHFRVFALQIGFSLAYGALFAKIWVAHKLNAVQKSRQIAATNAINTEEDSSTGGVGQLKMSAASGAAANSPWESIRTMFSAMVGRHHQSMIGTALRKISQHSSYGNLSLSGSGGGRNSTRRENVNLLNLPIHPMKFYVVAGSLCFLDLVTTVFWIGLDPMRRQEIQFSLQEPPAGMRLEDIMLMPVLELCQSQRHDIWTALVLGHKGLLLLFGLFLAYETWHLKLRYLNDLKSTLLSVANVTVLCSLTGPIVVLFLRSQANPFFGFVSATVCICTFVSTGMMFAPKVLFIYRNPVMSKEEQQHSSQLHQSNEQNSVVSRTEQLRYQQLLKENAELKRQIEMRNIKIQECRRILEGHFLLSSPRNKVKVDAAKAQSAHSSPLLNNNVGVAMNNNAENNNTTTGSSSNAPSTNPFVSSDGPSSSGGCGIAVVVEFEQPTTSTMVDPTTTITLLEQNGAETESAAELLPEVQEMAPVEEEMQAAGGAHQNGEGADTGVCSDYDEEDEDEEGEDEEDKEELMSTGSSDRWDEEGEEENEGPDPEEEILL